MKFLILMLFPSLALAFNLGGDKISASSHAYANAQAASTSISGAAAISGGNSQSVKVGGGKQANAQTVNVSGDSYKEVKQAPNVYAPTIPPTAPCMGASSGGGSGSGFGLSFGTSWTDDECNTRETARLFSGMGLGSDALAVLCSSKFAQAAPSCAAFRPVECHADEIVAKRLGVGVCKER